MHLQFKYKNNKKHSIITVQFGTGLQMVFYKLQKSYTKILKGIKRWLNNMM